MKTQNALAHVSMIAIALSLAACGSPAATPTPELSSGNFSQTEFSISHGCNPVTAFDGTTIMEIGWHTLSDSSLVAHLPGSSLRFEIDGANLSSPNVFQTGNIDYRDAGIGACDGISRAYDCQIIDNSDTTLSGTITGDDKVTFFNRVRFSAVGTECAAVVNSSARFAGIRFPCESDILASYEK